MSFSMILNVILIAVISITALLFGGLWMNRAPLMSPPGFTHRLSAYLSTNVAETATDTIFPELQPHRYELSIDALYTDVLKAIAELGWEEVRHSPGQLTPGQLTIEAVVTTRLWRFKDDVLVRIVEDGKGGVVFIRSQSRVGKGDFGANTRHILDLYRHLDQRNDGVLVNGDP